MTEESLDQLLRIISSTRGDFPDPLTVTVGVVSDGKIAAAFTIQNVDNWDDAKRSADYGAFAFFKTDLAHRIDILELLNRDFFWTPTRHPIDSFEYDGAKAARLPISSPNQLKTNRIIQLENPRAIGTLLSKYGDRCSRWIGIINENSSMTVSCGTWKEPT